MIHVMSGRLVPITAGQEGRSWWGPGDMYTFLVTTEESGGSMFALDCLVGAGGGPPPHRHHVEDELFTNTEGAISFTAGTETQTVSAGESVFVPRGMRHLYCNEAAVDDSSAPPPVMDELIQRTSETGPRHTVEWLD
jgi:quercetin dioxygenase-like cupin family protein